VLDRESFDDGAFKSAGGYNRIDKTFDHQLEALLGELVDEVWSDAG
jgi:type I restriction enzyme R subunit